MSSSDLGIPDIPDENGVLPRPGREQVWVVGNKFDALDASTVAPERVRISKKLGKPELSACLESGQCTATFIKF